MGKEKLIPIFALIVIIMGGLSSIYVYATTAESDYITINNTKYTIDQLFFIGEERTIDDYSGIAFDVVIFKISVSNPKTREYTLIASDGYQKTVKWENMENGLLTEEGQSIFSDLPKAFWVKDIIKIEVK